MDLRVTESKQSIFARLRRAPGCGVTELRFGSGDHVHAVLFDGVSWSLHHLDADMRLDRPTPRKLFAAGSLRELIAYLDEHWPLPA